MKGKTPVPVLRPMESEDAAVPSTSYDRARDPDRRHSVSLVSHQYHQLAKEHEGEHVRRRKELEAADDPLGRDIKA